MSEPRPANKIGRKRRAAGWTLLALGVIVAGVWVASGWWAAECYLNGGRRSVSFACGELRLLGDWAFGEEGFSIGTHGAGPAWKFLDRSGDANGWRSTIQLGVVNRAELGSGEYDWAVYPWPIPLLLWTPAAFLFRSGIIARRRAIAGNCSACGYSLTGIGKEAPCPECGKKKTD